MTKVRYLGTIIASGVTARASWGRRRSVIFRVKSHFHICGISGVGNLLESPYCHRSRLLENRLWARCNVMVLGCGNVVLRSPKHPRLRLPRYRFKGCYKNYHLDLRNVSISGVAPASLQFYSRSFTHALFVLVDSPHRNIFIHIG